MSIDEPRVTRQRNVTEPAPRDRAVNLDETRLREIAVEFLRLVAAAPVGVRKELASRMLSLRAAALDSGSLDDRQLSGADCTEQALRRSLDRDRSREEVHAKGHAANLSRSRPRGGASRGGAEPDLRAHHRRDEGALLHGRAGRAARRHRQGADADDEQGRERREWCFQWCSDPGEWCSGEEGGLNRPCFMARPVRFELTTSGFEGRRSIQLSYGRVRNVRHEYTAWCSRSIVATRKPRGTRKASIALRVDSCHRLPERR
jgi:hypothetical protein